jgi:hypothetical protein
MAIYFTAPVADGIIRGWQSRRLAHQAFALMDQRKWTEASSKARDAYLLHPAEPESWRAIARLASRTNQWPTALDWWKKVDDAGRLSVEDRSDFVGAALMTGELGIAAKQVEKLLAQRRGPTAHEILLAGQVALRRSDPVLALDYAERVLADKRAKPYDILSAATLMLSVTRPSSPPYTRAWKQIEEVARDQKDPASLDALVLLASKDALAPLPQMTNTALSLETLAQPGHANEKAGSSGGTPDDVTSTEVGTTESAPSPQSSGTFTLDLAATRPPAPAGGTMNLTEVANALEKHPGARPYHKLLALELRARQNPILTDQYVADAIERFGKKARQTQPDGDKTESVDETLAALAAWLNSVGRPAKTLEVLPQARAVQRQDLFVHYLNALAALQRWNEIKELLMSERMPIEPVVQHMYLAVARAQIGDATAAKNEWQRALEAGNTSEKLLALARYAEHNSASDVADSAYSGIIKIAPNNREAYTSRLHIALAGGRTVEAQKIAARIAELWPDDAGARNQDAYLRLLLGASDGAAETAARDAEVLVRTEPRNWLARATLGLARLRLGRNKDALAAIRQPRVTGVEPAGALAVRAAILAANGYEDGARNDARLLGAKPLLPEERALIAPLL